jgi:site-specific DNA-methyltransferase (adenine-specific)
MDGIILIDEDILIDTPKKTIKHERLNDLVTLFPGDCRDAMREFEDDCIDAVVTDAPYHLQSIVHRFGKENSAPPLDYEGGTGVYKRASAGFMGKQWDGGDIAFQPEFWREVFRIMKPGAHLVCFGGTRTYHRMACAIEDAGFEIRDCIQWLYGQGFPKSHDISKSIDKMNGAEREIIGVLLTLHTMDRMK